MSIGWTSNLFNFILVYEYNLLQNAQLEIWNENKTYTISVKLNNSIRLSSLKIIVQYDVKCVEKKKSNHNKHYIT